MKLYKKFIPFPKIRDYLTAVTNITHAARFVSFNEETQEPTYNNDPLPTITFTGTVKLHGTNASVCYNNVEGLWFQSRQNIITTQNDNAGFAFFAENNKDSFKYIIDQIAIDNNISLDEYTISLYGEWAGIGIQKGVGISNVDKKFYIFGVKISKPQDDEFVSYWIDSSKYSINENNIYNVCQFPTYSIDIDFNDYKNHVDELSSITDAIEKECPVAKYFGISGTGEGVVWVGEYKDSTYRFKVKGKKHSVVRSDKTIDVDPVKLESINAFIEYAVTDNRIDHGIQLIYGDGIFDKSKIGEFLKWIVNDIISEEGDKLIYNNLEPKDVNKYISTKARKLLFSKLDLI